jgi:hypothetical protein
MRSLVALLALLVAARAAAAPDGTPACPLPSNAGAALRCTTVAHTNRPPPASASATTKVLAPLPRFVAVHTARVGHSMVVLLREPTLEDARERDGLSLWRAGGVGGTRAALRGVALFTGATVFAAHAPRPLRRLVDRDLHFGPALLDGGGVGAGVAARF